MPIREGRPRIPPAQSLRCSMRVLHYVVAFALVLALAGSASAGKKGTAPAGAAVEKKIQISEATKIEKVSGKKGQKETKAATLSDVQKGSRVRVTLKAGQEQAADK